MILRRQNKLTSWSRVIRYSYAVSAERVDAGNSIMSMQGTLKRRGSRTERRYLDEARSKTVTPQRDSPKSDIMHERTGRKDIHGREELDFIVI